MPIFDKFFSDSNLLGLNFQKELYSYLGIWGIWGFGGDISALKSHMLMAEKTNHNILLSMGTSNLTMNNLSIKSTGSEVNDYISRILPNSDLLTLGMDYRDCT